MIQRIVPNKEYLSNFCWSINEPEIDEVAICKDTTELFRWTGEEWVPHTEPEAQIFDTGINLYDFNKQIVAQMKPYGDKELKNARGIINEFLSKIQSKYYMLLNRENNYYTVFNITDNDEVPYAASEIIECIKFLGDIKSVGITEDEQAVEIWFQTDENVFVAYLFDYQGAVIKCRI